MLNLEWMDTKLGEDGYRTSRGCTLILDRVDIKLLEVVR